MRVVVLCILCLFFVVSCNQVNQLEPVEPDPVPTKVIAHVKQWYPDAENLVFKPLLEKLVWEVKFDQGTDKYLTLADSTKIWETYRYKSEVAPPKLLELLGKSALKGGTFSANREAIGFDMPNHRNRLIYNLYGTDYLFDWLYLDGRIAGAAFDTRLYSFLLNDFSLLPQKVQAFVNADPNIKFEGTEVKLLLNYEKFYEVMVSFDKAGVKTYAYLYFNEAGDLRWFSRGFNEPENLYGPPNFDKLPDAIQQYLDASQELASFSTQHIASMQWMGEYRGFKCYTIRYLNNTTFDSCDLQFDAEGNLVNKSFFLYYQ